MQRTTSFLLDQGNMSASNEIRLEKCEPEEVVNYLLGTRFDGDIIECEKFVTNCQRICTEKKQQALVEKQNSMIGEEILQEDGTSFISPRGKFNLLIHSKGLALSTVKNEMICLSSTDVETMISFPKPEDLIMKKKPARYCIITLASEVKFRNKDVTIICFLQKSYELLTKIRQYLNIPEEDFIDIEGSSAINNQFRSEAPSQINMPFIQCYSGVNNGYLFPHELGLTFFRPPMFIPREHLTSIACGRGGSNNTRYIDLTLDIEEYKNAKVTGTVQFTNILREEIKPLKKYIRILQANSSNSKEEKHSNLEEYENKNSSRKRQRDASLASMKLTKRELSSSSFKDDEEEESDDDEDDRDFEVSDEDSTSEMMKDEEEFQRYTKISKRAESDEEDDYDDNDDEDEDENDDEEESEGTDSEDD